jgi:transcriptional regulator with XRE-family HTH domain
MTHAPAIGEVYMANIGKRVRELREGSEWTQTQLADRVGVAMNTISRLETGTSNPSAELVEKIARALGAHPGVLFEETPLPKAPAPASLERWLEARGAVWGLIEDEEAFSERVLEDKRDDPNEEYRRVREMMDEVAAEEGMMRAELRREFVHGGELLPKEPPGPWFEERNRARFRRVGENRKLVHERYGPIWMGLLNYSARLLHESGRSPDEIWADVVAELELV